MRLLLGLLFFSVLLTAGSSLQCEICHPLGDCPNITVDCPFDDPVCTRLILKSKYIKDPVVVKVCNPREECKQYESLIGKPAPNGVPHISLGDVITEVTCSKAPASLASFFPAFLGLLLMKLLF